MAAKKSSTREQKKPAEVEGLFVVDLRTLELSPSKCSEIEKAIQDNVMRILGTINEVKTANSRLGFEFRGFKPG